MGTMHYWHLCYENYLEDYYTTLCWNWINFINKLPLVILKSKGADNSYMFFGVSGCSPVYSVLLASVMLSYLLTVLLCLWLRVWFWFGKLLVKKFEVWNNVFLQEIFYLLYRYLEVLIFRDHFIAISELDFLSDIDVFVTKQKIMFLTCSESK